MNESPNFANAEIIKSSIIVALPFAFAKSDSGDSLSFQETFGRLSDFAAKFSKSPLNTETTRYQSHLLYLSLLLAGTRLFGADAIKFEPFTKEFVASSTFMLIISILMVSIAAIFVIKSYLDYTTGQWGWIKDPPSPVKAG